jgi:predicted ATPase/DNA-binding SARP family transcriptional activator
MHVAVLGPLEVRVDGRVITVAAPKQRALLATLVAADGFPVAAERLIEELWSADPPATAAAALQVHVSGLRKVFGARLRTVPAGYLLDVPTDARLFADEVEQARRHHATDRLADALAAWRGRAFEGVPAGPAVRAAAIRLELLRVAALEDWADWEVRPDRVAVTLAGTEPTEERLTTRLMLALYRTGRVADALAAYETLEEALNAIGTEPAAESVELAAAIARRDPTLDPPLATLPAPASRFVGRRRELDRLTELIGTGRLLTLTGPGGSGKTRLAIELARSVAPRHPDGVYLVELAGLTDPEAVTGRLASALGIRERAGEPVEQTVRDWLEHRRPLVVLDNCEHLRAATADLAQRLLRDKEGLRILATSREPLGVDGETVWLLAGLSVPEAGASPDEAAKSDAVRLLIDRASAARPAIRIHATEAGAICRRLDGLPLAIELVAAQLRVLSLAEIAQRLDRGFDLLATSTRTGRHHSLRAAIDWGYHLLQPAEQTLLRRLSVLAAGFTVAAAERVGADPGGRPPNDPGEILALLTTLVDRSMLVAHPGDAESRFSMLQMIHVYSREQAKASADLFELRSAQARHLAWYRALVESAPPLGGDDHELWLARFGAEHDNLLAALQHGVDTDPAAALAIASGLWWYWWTTGQMAEGRAWLDRALAAGSFEPATGRAPALRAAASLARNSGDYDTARVHGSQSLALYKEIGDDAGIAAVLNGLCMTSQAQGDLDASLRFGQESEALARRTGNPRAIAAAVNNVGCTLRVMGRLADAGTRFVEALEGFRSIADRRGEAAALTNLGILARRRGDSSTSRQHCLASLALYRELDLPEGELDMLDALACLELAAGRPAAALRLLLIADRERIRLGSPLFTPDEIADRNDALAGARIALDADEQAAVAAGAEKTALAAAVDALLGDK